MTRVQICGNGRNKSKLRKRKSLEQIEFGKCLLPSFQSVLPSILLAINPTIKMQETVIWPLWILNVKLG
jgi:hypothetical protein